MHGRGDALRHLLGIATGTHGHVSLRPRNLPERYVDLWEASVANAAIANIVVYAYDLPLNSCTNRGGTGNRLLHHQALGERVQPVQEPLGKILVHHSYSRSSRQ